MREHRPPCGRNSRESSTRLLPDGGRQIPTTPDPDAKKWRVIAVLDSGKPKHLGETYPREKAEELRDAHIAALNGDETSPVRPPKNTDKIRVMTIEEHEAQRLNWKLNEERR